MIALYAILAISAPFFFVDVPVVPVFVPVIHAIVCFTGFVAAAFLFSQFAVQPQPAFLVLAGAYMLAGLFALFQSLAFPHAYTGTGLLSSDPSVAAWLFLLWRTSFPLGVVVYALSRRPAAAGIVDRPVAVPIAATIVGVIMGACFLTWLVISGEQHLPTLFTDATHEAPNVHYTTIPAIILSLAAVVLLSSRGRATLDLWLIVTLVAALPDILVPVSRYALGFYLARSYELISSCAILIALLTEASILYARLATAKALQVQGEAERLGSLSAATGAIAHELRQPLNAIRINAHTGVRLLHLPAPALGEVEEVLTDIDRDVCLANDVIDRVREMIRGQEIRTDVTDINAVVSDAVRLVSETAGTRSVEFVTSLGERSHVDGDRTRIMQVLMNLMLNAMDAMEAVPPPQRRLTVRTATRDGAVVVSVGDCGCGISPENLSRIFNPFFTTRSGGMGLGLAISQSIVTAHKGRIWAENNPDQGATFYVSLPVRMG